MESNIKLSMPAVFGDNMILQRGTPLRIFGCGEGEIVVRLGGEAMTTACENGRWQLTLPPQEACSETSLVVESAAERLVFTNVAIGEVWLAGGQSNMEFPLRYDAEGKHLIALANDGLLRFFDQPKISYEGQEQDEDFSQSGFWRSATPEDAPYFSAVGYHFAGLLRSFLQVPVGIVGCNWGGTSAACWLSQEALENEGSLGIYMDNYNEGLEKIDMEAYPQRFKEERKVFNSPEFIKTSERLNYGNLTPEELEEIMKQGENNFVERQLGPMDPMRPCGLYYTMLQRLVPFTFKGVIWYQGETDADRHELYPALFGAMIENWRRDFERELPFLFVQLAPFGRWLGGSGEFYPQLREAQRKVSQTIPAAWMASIMDCGERSDIHPKKKRPVGERLALLALGEIYGFCLISKAPYPKSHCRNGNILEIEFGDAGSGLVVKGNEINGLELLDKNNKPVHFEAKAEGSRLIINAADACRVLYAKADYVEANLYSSAGLCAAPFEIQLGK